MPTLIFLLILTLMAEQPGVHPVSGRKIAQVMGMSGADWLVRPEREQEEQPERALDLIGVRPGMTVADVGAGVGYFSLRLARRVGPKGKVYANDLQAEMLEKLKDSAARKGIRNIETIVGSETDPCLPVESMDLVLLVDVYHEFSRPREMLAGIRAAMKRDGRLVLLEYRQEDPEIPIREEHKMSIEQVRSELAPEAMILEGVISDLPRQHILIFRKKPN